MIIPAIFLSSVLAAALSQTPNAIAYLRKPTGELLPGNLTFTTVDTSNTEVDLNLCGLEATTGYQLVVDNYGDLLSNTDTIFSSDGKCVSATGVLLEPITDSTGCASLKLTATEFSLYANETSFIIGRNVYLRAAPGVKKRSDSCAETASVLARGVIGIKDTSSPATSTPAQTVSYATALIQSTSTQSFSHIGSAIFTQFPTYVHVSIYIRNLAPFQNYGIHIHTFGDLTSASTTGGHFNPYTHSHACPFTEPRHAGAMGNFQSDSNGVISAEFMNYNVTLNVGPINSIIGRSIVIHNGTDDCVSQPAGNSGPRAAHGVIGFAKSMKLPVGFVVFESFEQESVNGTATFTKRHDGSTWGVNAKIEVSSSSSTTKGFQIYTYGDLTNVRGGSLGKVFSINSNNCIYPNKGSFTSDSMGKTVSNIFSTDLSLDPAKTGFVIGRSAAILSESTNCGSGSILAAGVVGYQLNSPTLQSNTNQNVAKELQAICRIKGSGISGNVTFISNSTGVNVLISVNGAPANRNLGIHIHSFGDISKADASATGGHYNPTNVNHSCPITEPRHAGGMGNFFTNDGRIRATFFNNLVTINPTDLVSIIGRSVVIHNGTDDCVSQPAGNSGPRIAQCVIGETQVIPRSTPTLEPTNAPTNPPIQTPTVKPTPTPTPTSGASALITSCLLFFPTFFSVILFF